MEQEDASRKGVVKKLEAELLVVLWMKVEEVRYEMKNLSVAV